MSSEDNEIEPVEIEYVIHKKVVMEQFNRTVRDGYDQRTTERFILEALSYHDVEGVFNIDNFKSMESAMLFITKHRKELQYMDLVIIPEVKIPNIYE